MHAHRDVGPSVDEVPLYFGHAVARPRGAPQALDPEKDIEKDNVVAIAMADEDARVWGRRFDIAIVTSVNREERDGALSVEYGVRYYSEVGTQPGEHSLMEEDFYRCEHAQVEGEWKQTQQESTISSSSVLCQAWVEDREPRKGRLHPEYKRYLWEALGHLDEL